jgi:hypothetical protein
MRMPDRENADEPQKTAPVKRLRILPGSVKIAGKALALPLRRVHPPRREDDDRQKR